MRKTAYRLLLLCVVGVISACHQRTPEEPLQQTDASTHYASLLQMQDLDNGMTLCRILNPWQPERIAMQYLLIPGDTLSDEELDEIEAQYGRIQTLHTPLRQQTLTASCHASLYAELQALDCVGVLCDAEYILNPQVLAQLESGRIVEAGGSMAPNPEIILSAQSEAIWVTPYDAGSQAMITAILPQIPIIYCADYQETSPLGRAEWMRFYGRLVNKAAEADQLFNEIETKYNNIASQNDSSDLPLKGDGGSILSDLPYGATWYVPGGRSSASWIYQDAGFQYPWADDTHGGSLALSAEAVYAQASDADVWVFKYFDPEASWTLASLLAQNPLYGQFKAAQTGQVYGCNTARSDYFEVAPFHPERILTEMRHIRLGETDSLIYFRQLPKVEQ